MSGNRQFIYTLPENVLLDLTLNAVDLRVYALVRSFMDTTGVAYFSNSWAAEKLAVARCTISRAISKLIKRHHITATIDGNNRRHLSIKIGCMHREIDDLEDPPTSKGVDLNAQGVEHLDQGGVDLNANQLDQRYITSKIKNNYVHFSEKQKAGKQTNIQSSTKVQTEEAFKKLWEYYPVKKGKQEAYKAFLKLCVGKTLEEIKNLTQEVWDGLVGMLQEDRWLREFKEHECKKAFIPHLPHASTFFNQKRWLDSYERNGDNFIQALRVKHAIRSII